MFRHFYIIDQGLCIYSYHFQQKTLIDEQLLSGFLSAMGSFALEAFRTGLQGVQIRNGEKLNFYVDPHQGLLLCAISDERDNNRLLESILAEIGVKFIELMGTTLKSAARAALDQYRKFDPVLTEILKGKDKRRSRRTVIQGFVVGIFTLILFLIPLGVITSFVSTADLFYQIAMLIFDLCFLLSVSTFVCGFYAGSPRMGLRAGVGLYFLLLVLSAYVWSGLFWYYVILTPFSVIVCAASGYYGGLTCDRKKLYP